MPQLRPTLLLQLLDRLAREGGDAKVPQMPCEASTDQQDTLVQPEAERLGPARVTLLLAPPVRAGRVLLQPKAALEYSLRGDYRTQMREAP